MADKYMQLVLTPAVQRAQDKYFGRHQVVENAPETDALTLDEVGFIVSRDSFFARQLLHGNRKRDRLAVHSTPRRSTWFYKPKSTKKSGPSRFVIRAFTCPPKIRGSPILSRFVFVIITKRIACPRLSGLICSCG